MSDTLLLEASLPKKGTYNTVMELCHYSASQIQQTEHRYGPWQMARQSAPLLSVLWGEREGVEGEVMWFRGRVVKVALPGEMAESSVGCGAGRSWVSLVRAEGNRSELFLAIGEQRDPDWGSLNGTTLSSGSLSIGKGKETISVPTISKLYWLGMLTAPFYTLLKVQRGSAMTPLSPLQLCLLSMVRSEEMCSSAVHNISAEVVLYLQHLGDGSTRSVGTFVQRDCRATITVTPQFQAFCLWSMNPEDLWERQSALSCWTTTWCWTWNEKSYSKRYQRGICRHWCLLPSPSTAGGCGWSPG